MIRILRTLMLSFYFVCTSYGITMREYVELEPPFSKDQMLMSQLCTESQVHTDLYNHWCSEIKETPKNHRKQWEFVYIAQALSERGLLKKGKKGIGFGVGQEPLPSLFAKYGVKVLATDVGLPSAVEKGWAQSSQHMSSLETLNKFGIADDHIFRKLVSIKEVDMNHIPEELKGYDFTWSSCALEHLGSIEAGLKFIVTSLQCLKPGGVAVHTTEYNLSSNTDTIDMSGTVIFREADIRKLVKELTKSGHEIYVNYNPGHGKLDTYVDIPPYSSDKHLKLKLGQYASTSIGLIIRKAP